MTKMTALLEDDALRTFMGAGGRWATATGARVKARRNNLGFTLQQIADMAGTTVNTIHRVETGALVPRDTTKVAIAFALFCEVDELWPWPPRTEVHEHAAVTVAVA